VPARAEAGEPTPGRSGPSIQFAESVHDFGRIDAGSVVTHEFVFTNAGNATLEILDVRPGCGCTTAGGWDKQVAPGQTGRIPLAFNSAGYSGTVAKSVLIACNDLVRSNVFLQVKATIWRPIDTTPQSAYFHLSSDATSNETRIVRIVNNLEAPLTLSQPVWTNETFRVALRTVTPGREFELAVTVRPSSVSTFVQTPITLKTSVTNLPVLTIPAYAYVQPAVMAMPSQVTLPPGPLATAARSLVTIRSTGTHPLAVSNATVNAEGLTLDLKETQRARAFTLTLHAPAGFQLPSTQKVEISIESNHPDFPRIKVPVSQPQGAARSTLGTTPSQTPSRVAWPGALPAAK